MKFLKIRPALSTLAFAIFSMNSFAQHTGAPKASVNVTSPENCADEIMKNFMNRDGVKAKKGSDNYKNGLYGLGPWPGFKAILFQCEQNKDHLQTYMSCVLDIREGMQASVKSRPTVSIAEDASTHVAPGDKPLIQNEFVARLKKALDTADYAELDRQRSMISNETAAVWCHLARPDAKDSRSYDDAVKDFKECSVLLYNHTSLMASFISNSCRQPNARVFSDCVKKSWSGSIGNDFEKQNALVRDCQGQSFTGTIQKVPSK